MTNMKKDDFSQKRDETVEEEKDKKEFSLFREKSLEAIQSPESLTDYLKVTSPGVWLVLGTVIVLLAGAILWGIFGRITTTVQLPVLAEKSTCVCIVPYSSLQKVVSRGVVTVDGQDYVLKTGEDMESLIVDENTNPYIRVIGGLEIGDMTVKIPLAAGFEDGVYTGTAVTESLQPISLLLQ